MVESIDREERLIKKQKLKINKKKAVRSLCILVLFIYVLHVIWVHFLVNRYNKLIYPGVKVEGVKLSGKTQEEAVNILRNKYINEILKKNIVIKIDNNMYTINYSKLNINYNIGDTIKNAFDYGKSGDMSYKYKIIRSGKEKNFYLEYSYNKKEIEKTISKIEGECDKKPVNANMTKDKNDKFQITKEKIGYEVEKDKLFKDIDREIGNRDIKDIIVDARIKKVEPAIKKSDLQKIDTKISSFATDFSSSTANRVNNIQVASKTLNGTVVMPNETFSFNKIVGERTAERGYEAAHVIVGDKVESGLGGGVCQVSSTLHNAVVGAGIVPTERDHHNVTVSYVGIGMDATVDYGNIDYKFKNTLGYPIYIECTTDDKKLTFNIYSNSKLTKKTYKLVNSVKTVNRSGKAVCEAKAYKVTYEDGKEISRDEINSDCYVK